MKFSKNPSLLELVGGDIATATSGYKKEGNGVTSKPQSPFRTRRATARVAGSPENTELKASATTFVPGMTVSKHF